MCNSDSTSTMPWKDIEWKIKEKKTIRDNLARESFRKRGDEPVSTVTPHGSLEGVVVEASGWARGGGGGGKVCRDVVRAGACVHFVSRWWPRRCGTASTLYTTRWWVAWAAWAITPTRQSGAVGVPLRPRPSDWKAGNDAAEWEGSRALFVCPFGHLGKKKVCKHVSQ